jgi:uncharacterized membrane protein YbaN (DUF454 family)
MRNITKTLLVISGTLFVILAVVGIFIPVLPTTPFLLLAAFCYARSSKRFYGWLLTNRWFGEYLKNYREGRGIPLRQKILTILLLWLTIGFTVVHIISLLWIKIVLLGIAVAVSIHLFWIKSIPEKAR